MMVRAWFRAECASVPTEVGSLCRVCIATGKRSALPLALKVSVEGSPQLSRALSRVMLDGTPNRNGLGIRDEVDDS